MNSNGRLKPGQILSAPLIVLFSYAALSKSLDLPQFEAQLLVHPFSRPVAVILAFLIPAAEFAAVILLLFDRTFRAGFWLSFILMFEFSGYVALVLLHFWKRVPCPCGGILGKMGWGPHLAFNLFFLAITIMGIVLNSKERRAGDP